MLEDPELSLYKPNSALTLLEELYNMVEHDRYIYTVMRKILAHTVKIRKDTE